MQLFLLPLQSALKLLEEAYNYTTNFFLSSVAYAIPRHVNKIVYT